MLLYIIAYATCGMSQDHKVGWYFRAYSSLVNHVCAYTNVAHFTYSSSGGYRDKDTALLYEIYP